MEARTDAASLSLYIQVTFVTFSRLIVRPLRVRVLMRRRPRSRRCLKTHNTPCCPHQQVAEGLVVGGRVSERIAGRQSKYFHFQHSSATRTHECHCVHDKQAFWLSCVEVISIWWPIGHAVETHVSLSCISRFCRTPPARCSSTAGSLECEMGKERTGGLGSERTEIRGF